MSRLCLSILRPSAANCHQLPPLPIPLPLPLYKETSAVGSCHVLLLPAGSVSPPSPNRPAIVTPSTRTIRTCLSNGARGQPRHREPATLHRKSILQAASCTRLGILSRSPAAESYFPPRFGHAWPPSSTCPSLGVTLLSVRRRHVTLVPRRLSRCLLCRVPCFSRSLVFAFLFRIHHTASAHEINR